MCTLTDLPFDLKENEKLLLIKTPNNQTIISIGLSKKENFELKSIVAPLGTDRIVRPGSALNMDIEWDGYDIISYMSRLFSI